MMLSDLELLRSHGLAAELDCVTGSVPVVQAEPVRKDVGSFHADSATSAGRYMALHLPWSQQQGLQNEESLRRVGIATSFEQRLFCEMES